MDNLVFALNASVPIFLLMVLGAFFKKIGWIDDSFASKMNGFVFKVSIPVLLFHDLASINFQDAWNTKFVLFCFFATLASILISFFISLIFKDRSIRGEFIQASYRSSAAILGVALTESIYGSSGMGPLMIVGSVPLYNIVAVLVLTVFGGSISGKPDKKLIKNTLIGIIKNPIIIGIAIGLLWCALGIPFPVFLEKTTSKLGAVSTPMGLIAMGASFEFKKTFGKIAPAITASFLKLIGFCALFLPIAALLGFRNQEMVAILVMLGSCSTVAGYIMARNMGHEGTVASSTVMITTMFSAFTLAFWLFILRTYGLV